MSPRALYEKTIAAFRHALVEHACETPGFIPHGVEILVSTTVFDALVEGSFHDPLALVDRNAGTLRTDRICFRRFDDLVDRYWQGRS